MMILKEYRRNRFFKNKNALDLIPIRKVSHEVTEKGTYCLLVKRFQLNFLGAIFRRSSYFKIKLDVTGSEVWKLIDGNRSVNEIVAQLDNHENMADRVVFFLTDLYRKELVDFRR